ncbi:diacylglycerol kinase family protein [Microbacterium sp. SORGH_AS_0888]|uniref:diacylglycerol/lipid kinase family protein n=1 Tax=Microbacterium sp. SORGH_AS_0888 TaxID=3041791 RepID=UPI0027D88DF4|nr:diacylglycerol kinase family protein [Microbacterium sp. SORGH_AS_0888]
MTQSRVGIVFNPSKIEREPLEKAWAEVGGDADTHWFETTPEDPGQGMAREAVDAGCDLVIAAGGDGTVRAVAEVLAGTGVHLGIVPQGTGNLLARNLGVPLGNVSAALRRIADAEARAIDVGWVETDTGDRQAFVVMVGFGLDAQMLAETDDDLKSKAGWLAYVEAMGRALAASDVLDVTIAIDDGDPVATSAHTVLVGNCGTLQGGITLLPDAVPDDGVLDTLVVRSDGVLQWMDTLRSMVWENGLLRLFDKDRKAASTQTVDHAQARRVRVELPEPRAFEIDGEEVGEVGAFTASIDAGALVVR